MNKQEIRELVSGKENYEPNGIKPKVDQDEVSSMYSEFVLNKSDDCDRYYEEAIKAFEEELILKGVREEQE